MMRPDFKIWIFLFLILLLIPISLLLTGNLQEDLFVHFINVGYGDSILIEFPHGKNMLIDSGSTKNAINVINYFNERKIKRIDTIVITHLHEDHIGGLSAIVKKYDFNTIITYDDISTDENSSYFFRLVKDKSDKIKKVRRGDEINISKSIKLKILHPDKLRKTQNDSSIVIKLTYKKISFLFTADIGPNICKELIQIYGRELKSNILKVPWHGKTRSKDFIRIVEPELAIISVGPYKWPGPSKEVLQDYRDLEVPVLRTDKFGSIVVRTDGNRFWVITEKNK
jgi:beta-lactamase superfamily II metal-dependent hydrolase